MFEGATPSPSAPATAAPATAAPAPSAPATAAPASLTIYGASSLSAVLAKVKTTYEAANPGTTLTISTDSSSALETQIEQGAPADVFLSADTTNPQKLVDKGLAAGGITKFAGNLLTVIVPTGNPAGIQTPADLAKIPGVAPAGRYPAPCFREPGLSSTWSPCFNRERPQRANSKQRPSGQLVPHLSASASVSSRASRAFPVDSPLRETLGQNLPVGVAEHSLRPGAPHLVEGIAYIDEQ